MRIESLTVDGLERGCVTDEPPRFAFSLGSDVPGEALRQAHVRVGEWETTTTEQVGIAYRGPLQPFTEYTVELHATGVSGSEATARTSFRTGRLDTPWAARWITDAAYETPKGISPVPMVFRVGFQSRPGVRRAWLESTALGVYELQLNGVKVGQDYFAPGFTSYRHHIQYQTYDVTDQLASTNTLTATVAGGWAVGAFTVGRKSRTYADRQALLCELHIEYDDGTSEMIATGPDWEVSTDGPVQMAEWYDGETRDARVTEDRMTWKAADITAPRARPAIVAQYGPPVRAQRIMSPVAQTTSPTGEVVYDFGQNFAGVVSARLSGEGGQRIVFRHAEVLVDGELYVESLRTAKATATYTCVDGEQTFSPRHTYMGFRYVGVRGIDPEDLELSALVLHSDLPETGSFTCSDPDLDRLQEAIQWSTRSNFIDVPTDCPQRDEREAWTGDLAVFAPTATFNFDTGRFLGKWLRDLRAEQGVGGGFPMVVPRAGNGFPPMASSCWGDVCVLAPWAEYQARGDLQVLRDSYPSITKFLAAAGRWAAFGSVRPNQRRIWKKPYHWGDWLAPDSSEKEWYRRAPWIATAYYANSTALAARIAELLSEHGDAIRYRRLHQEIVTAYREVFTDGHGTLRDEFQTGYVLPLAFGMAKGDEMVMMAENLSRLIAESDGHLATGFPGTPHILFALSDSGRVDDAYALLQQTSSPSWLYMIRSGGTTIWERWDALRPDGTVNLGGEQAGGESAGMSGGMVSFNHYAAGAVGDWLYRRVGGIEPISGGYRTFRVAPVVGGGLTSATASVRTPYGPASSSWQVDGDSFVLRVEVPVSTRAVVELPDGTRRWVESGTHELQCGLLDSSEIA